MASLANEMMYPAPLSEVLPRKMEPEVGFTAIIGFSEGSASSSTAASGGMSESIRSPFWDPEWSILQNPTDSATVTGGRGVIPRNSIRRLENRDFGDFECDFRAFRRSECIKIYREWRVNLISVLQAARKHTKSTF